VNNLGKVLSRIDAVLAAGTFDSEREWCRKAEVSGSYIGALRTKHAKGQATTAKLDMIAKLARAANVSVDYLMGGNAGPTAPVVEAPREASPNLASALEAYPWAEFGTLTPDLARRVVEQVRREAFAGGGVDLPQSYWHARIGRLVDEALGRAKSVTRRADVSDVDLTQESPEVRAHKARLRRG
jgi:hypothetical protein